MQGISPERNDMSKHLLNSTIYNVFVRNFSKEGTFEGVKKQLPRIKSLGADILWLLPIHPLGEKQRKGALGSPYAISDYRAVNPEFGTLQDFINLCDSAHELGLKVMIDIVYNHTSPDSWLAQNHPEWFYHKEDGSFGNRVGDWWDVIDLDYRNKELWQYQIDTLTYWAQWVDGFRCDVAPMVPLEFWLKAHEAVEKVRSGAIWLAESVEKGFVGFNRELGFPCSSDGELYQAFDLTYDYDIKPQFYGALVDGKGINAYIEAVKNQFFIYPENGYKMRGLENHDRVRVAHLIRCPKRLKAWTAYIFFLRGTALIYNGQEYAERHRPTLFDLDTIRSTASMGQDLPEGGMDLSDFIRTLSDIKKKPIVREGWFTIDEMNGCALMSYKKDNQGLYGFFPLDGPAAARVDAPEGRYVNLLDGSEVLIEMGIAMIDRPVIFEAE